LAFAAGRRCSASSLPFPAPLISGFTASLAMPRRRSSRSRGRKKCIASKPAAADMLEDARRRSGKQSKELPRLSHTLHPCGQAQKQGSSGLALGFLPSFRNLLFISPAIVKCACVGSGLVSIIRYRPEKDLSRRLKICLSVSAVPPHQRAVRTCSARGPVAGKSKHTGFKKSAAEAGRCSI
jgi:hypothetical protein